MMLSHTGGKLYLPFVSVEVWVQGSDVYGLLHSSISELKKLTGVSESFSELNFYILCIKYEKDCMITKPG